MARATFVNKARKDIPEAGIKAGESYYWWKFRFGGKHYSKTAPKRSQLTQSAFYSQVYDIEDDIAGAAADDSLRDIVEDVVSRLNDLADECEGNLQNMPEQLQSSPTGEMLQERADALRSAAEEFEAIDLSDWDEDFDEPEREEDETDDEFNERVEEARQEAEMEHWQGLLDEVQSVSIDAP